jgi:polyhydroxyalkanoate synthase
MHALEKGSPAPAPHHPTPNEPTRIQESAEVLPILAERGDSIRLHPAMTKPGPVPPRLPEEKTKLSSPFVGGVGAREVILALSELGGQLISKPHILMEETEKLARELGRAASGDAPAPAAKADRRFSDAGYSLNPFLRFAKDNYLAWVNAWGRVIDKTVPDPKAQERMRYVSQLFTDALSPENTLLGNPAALKRMVETGGRSLLDGARNMLTDLAQGNATPAQVDKTAFQVGRNLAATPGAVVFRNDILELIQYVPATDEVHAIPTLMVPPVVNKFYMMDMAPGRSLVEHMVASGFQPFMISWRNPSERHRDWGLDDYVAAMLEAMEAVRQITGNDTMNMFTICTGVVPLAALLGHLAARKDGRVNSVTMVVSVIDSFEGRSLGLFATPEAIESAKSKSHASGILDGEEMNRIFTWMRPRDLVWNYWVNNYLMGQQPPALDLLYWSNDSIRLTSRLHAEILDIYTHDLLSRPGELTVLGTPINVSKVTAESYFVAGATDHISMWKGVYKTAQAFGGPFEFVLHSSGHVQSVINPPGTPKAHYYVNPNTPDDPEAWLYQATCVADSWWSHWLGWLGRRSGAKRPAPAVLGSDRHRPKAKAPGTYVIEP